MLAKTFPGVSDAPYALLTSAELLERSGRLHEAASTFEDYSKKYSARHDAISALFRAGLAYEKMKDIKEQIRIYRSVIARFSTQKRSGAWIVEANTRLGHVFQVKEDWKRAKRYYEEAISEFSDRGLTPGKQAKYAATARFELVDATYRTYKSIRLREGMSLSRQQKALKRKLKLLVELANEDTGLYMKVARYKYNPMSVAAYVRMAQMPLEFADMLYRAPDPEGLSAEELDLYRQEIERVASGQEDFAVEKLEVAHAAARRLKIDNEWSRLALTILNRYKPHDYPLEGPSNEAAKESKERLRERREKRERIRKRRAERDRLRERTKPTAPSDKLPNLIHSFKGAVNYVYAVAFHPNGKVVLTGNGDHTVNLVELSTGKLLRTFKGHSNTVNSGAFSPDGRHALSGSSDATLKLWEIASGKLIRTLEGHSSSVNSVAFGPKGKLALSGGGGPELKLWDVSTGTLIRSFEGHIHKRIHSVAFRPDGKTALSAGSDKTLRLWDVSTGALIRTFKGHKGAVSTVAFHPNGKVAVTGDRGDYSVKLWDVSTGALIRTFGKHMYQVEGVAFSPDGDYVLSAGGRIKLWALASGKLLHSLETRTATIYSIAFSPDGNAAISGGMGDLKHWDLRPFIKGK
jgi:tetratricopeptide (TPR) repeat protein